MDSAQGGYSTYTDFLQLFLLGSALCGGAQDVSYLFAGRIIAGIAVGQVSHVVPLYLAEISPAQFRGALVSCLQLGISKSQSGLERRLSRHH